MGSKFNFKLTDLRWRANYTDGTVLWELDPNTHQEHLFKEIAQKRLKSFDLLLPIKEMEDVKISETDIQVVTGDDKPSIISLKIYNRLSLTFFHIELTKDQRLIFVRRKRRTSGRQIAIVKTTTGDLRIPFPVPAGGTIIIIGWQRKIGSENIQAINYIFPHGQIELAGQWGTDATHIEATGLVKT